MVRTPDASPQTVAVLGVLLEDPARLRYGYDLAKETGLASGTLYPILARLTRRGYLQRHWEPKPVPGRPARQLYQLTAAGVELARGARDRAAGKVARRSLQPPEPAGA